MGPHTLRRRFVEELFEWTGVVDSIEEPAAAEVWASSAVAEWVELGGDAAVLAALVTDRAPLAASLIDWIVSGAAPPDGPEWVAEVGRCEARSAVEVRSGDELAVVIEYASTDGSRHDLSVTMNAGVVVGLSVGPSGLAEAVRAGEVEGMEVGQLDVEEALTIVRQALGGLGDRRLPDSSRLNVPLFLRRFEVDSSVESRAIDALLIVDRDVDDDRYAADLMRSALRVDDDVVAPRSAREAARKFAAKVSQGDPDALTLIEVAGGESAGVGSAPSLDDEQALRMLLGATGSYLAPRSLAPHDRSECEAILELESADWLGAILSVVRAGVGVAVSGRSLVAGINQCPEVTTTIPKADAERIAWAFELTLYAWQVTGVLDEDGSLAETGVWLLPRAAIFAWDQH